MGRFQCLSDGAKARIGRENGTYRGWVMWPGVASVVGT